MTLEQFFQNNRRAAVAFSGGADSAYLLWAAGHYGCDMHAYYVKTAFQPEFELRDAQRLASQIHVPLTVIREKILEVPGVCENGPDRCYICKRALFSRIQDKAGKDGYTLLLDGTNASDDADDRPGMRALRELQVRSPLRECGLTKAQVRRLSEKAGLFTWNKPAYACLATRVPTGQHITGEDLEHVEKAEEILRRMGLYDFRVRLISSGARIQVREEQIPLVIEKRKEIVSNLKTFFDSVTLDLEARKASD